MGNAAGHQRAALGARQGGPQGQLNDSQHLLQPLQLGHRANLLFVFNSHIYINGLPLCFLWVDPYPVFFRIWFFCDYVLPQWLDTYCVLWQSLW